MNLRKFKLMSMVMGYALHNRDPFSAAGTNIFDEVEKRKQASGAPDGQAQHWSPSQAVPGKDNPYPTPGQGALETGANRSGGSPLDSYMDNAHNYTADKDDGKEKQQKPAGVLDQGYDQFSKSLESANFTADADAELADKALKGDSKALLALMNTTARRAAAGSAYLSSQVTKQGLSEFDGSLKQTMPSMLTEQEFSRLTLDDPALKDPKLQPIVQSTIKMFRDNYPKASPADIKTAVSKYLKEVIATPKGSDNEKTGPSMRDLFAGIGG